MNTAWGNIVSDMPQVPLCSLVALLAATPQDHLSGKDSDAIKVSVPELPNVEAAEMICVKYEEVHFFPPATTNFVFSWGKLDCSLSLF